ncbi:hypothetical protein BJ138DRAFT_1114709 [Hygrophoropsis aurantiaca]|uniref:Uncharacterized protein n=1 Tax=Hygrophoropsis aurantiaca TaxID=72124 RepID=A0ACB8A947_9AGAM|nr:hypothetical protein BJ138DRAFT_1114709 [Hygrophoropsis aurantiaca]
MSTSTTPSPESFPKIDIVPTIGMDLIGIIFAAVFYGITCLQAIFYYRTYPKDKLVLKLLVIILWALDTLSLALFSHGVYTYLVLDFADPLSLEDIVWSIYSEPVVTAAIALIVHLFLVYRIRTWLVNILRHSGVHIVFSSLDGGFDYIYYVYKTMSSFPSTTNLSHPVRNSGDQEITSHAKLYWIAIAGIVSTSVIDLIIAASISWLLYQNRNGFSHTERVIHTLTMFVITTGFITASLTLAVMISNIASPNTLISQMIEMSTSKAYTNTFLATLNSRQSIRGYPTTFESSKIGPANDYVLPFRAASRAQISDFDPTVDNPRMLTGEQKSERSSDIERVFTK